jgi:hypothetical protein
MYKGKKVILTTTACKRIKLLHRAIKSFGVFCQDKNIIDEIYYFDDSSTPEERRMGLEYYHTHIPNVPVFYRFFEKETFPDNYRHARVLNFWRKAILDSNADYVFHLEDDHQFYNLFTIGKPIDLMEQYPEYAYVGYCFNYRNFPENMKPKREIGDFFEAVYFPDRPVNDLLFLDDVGAMQISPDIWMYCINWPEFSLRPGVHHAKKLLSVGEFSTTYDRNSMSVELEFAIRWRNMGYKSLSCKNFTSLHTGGLSPELSAYAINNSAR